MDTDGVLLLLDCDILPLITYKEIALGRDVFLASMDKKNT